MRSPIHCGLSFASAVTLVALLGLGCQSSSGHANGTIPSGGSASSGGVTGPSTGGVIGNGGSGATAGATAGQGGMGGTNLTGGTSGGVSTAAGTGGIVGGAGGALSGTGGTSLKGGTTGASKPTGGTTGSGGVVAGGTGASAGGAGVGGTSASAGGTGASAGGASAGGASAGGASAGGASAGGASAGAASAGSASAGAASAGSGAAGGKTGAGGSAGRTTGAGGSSSGGSIGGSSGSSGWAVRMANSVIARHPNPDTVSSSNFSWEVGYTMWAMEKVWRSTQDPKYFAYLKKYVDQHVDAAGSLSGFSASRLDNFLPGYAILLLFEETKDPRYSTAAGVIRKAFATYPRNSDGGFWHSTGNPNQMWVDGVFMGQMFLARYGHALGDSTAFDEVVKQMTIIVTHCMKTDGLLLHAYDESKKASWANPTTGLSPEVWSEGLGWYAVLIADVFDYLPTDHPGRPGLMTILGQLTAGLKTSQDAQSGRWCQVVDKCTLSDNWNESSGTGMFLYLTKKSIDQGYIDAATYGPVVDNAYKGLVQKATANSDGTLDINDCSSIGVQGSYSAYVSKAKQVSPPSCVASFMAGTGIVETPSSAAP